MNNLYKDTFLIVYPTGAYGTFLDWCINWFSGQIDENVLPFTLNGSAHKWRGDAAGDVISEAHKTIEWFLEQPKVPFTVRTHLTFTEYKKAEHENLIKSYQKNFKKVILINNDPDCHLLMFHNTMTKSNASSYNRTIDTVIRNYKDRFNAGSSIPNWQLREMISFWHGDWNSQLRDTWQPIPDEKIVNVGVKNLVYNFEECLCDLFDNLKITMVRRNSLTEIKNQWLSLQKFKDSDQYFNNIVSNIATDQPLQSINCNNIFDEAFIQWKLRSIYNLDLMCFGLNEFPKNSADLKTLLVPYLDKG